MLENDLPAAGTELQAAWELADQGNLEEDRRSCATAVGRDVLDPGASLLMASIAQEQGEPATAMETAPRAVYLAPEPAPAHFLLGSLLCGQGQARRARRCMETVTYLLDGRPPSDRMDQGRALTALPLDSVQRAVLVAPEAIERLEAGHAIRWRNGQALPVSRLTALLGLREDEQQEPGGMERCVVLSSGEEQIGLLVAEVLGEREVLAKELKPPLVRVPNVAGAGVLGSGQMVQTAGYRVRVAVDGLEAWTLLKGEAFDLVVSDVDMPRLDGFGLTERIRADRQLADLPVILVTALESREDKERGIEAGANAYVVKSSFDQSNLLAIIRRLA